MSSFLGCEEENLFDADKSIYFKVNVNITEPLWTGIIVKVNGKSIWFHFKYLKPPDFFHSCGRLGHVLKVCEYVESILIGYNILMITNLNNLYT